VLLALAVWLLKQENLVNVLEHNLVVVRFSVKLYEVAVKVQTVITVRDEHW
jgi:hypothetical protein